MIIQSIVQSIIQPIVRSVIDPIIISQGFSPKSLFASGEQGAWYDPRDLSTMFQDAAGTTPVTAAGQPVGLIRDKSGRGNHASQVTAGSKPMLRNTGALWYLQFDGIDDFLATGNIDFTQTDKIGVFSGMNKNTNAATGIFVETSLNTNTNNGCFYLAAPVTTGMATVTFNPKGTAQTSVTINLPAASNTVLTAQSDISGSMATMRKDGVAAGSSSSSQGSGNYGNYPLYIGRRGGTSLPFTGYLYGLIIRGALTDAAGITSTEKYLAAKSGVTL